MARKRVVREIVSMRLADPTPRGGRVIQRIPTEFKKLVEFLRIIVDPEPPEPEFPPEYPEEKPRIKKPALKRTPLSVMAQNRNQTPPVAPRPAWFSRLTIVARQIAERAVAAMHATATASLAMATPAIMAAQPNQQTSTQAAARVVAQSVAAVVPLAVASAARAVAVQPWPQNDKAQFLAQRQVAVLPMPVALAPALSAYRGQAVPAAIPWMQPVMQNALVINTAVQSAASATTITVANAPRPSIFAPHADARPTPVSNMRAPAHRARGFTAIKVQAAQLLVQMPALQPDFTPFPQLHGRVPARVSLKNTPLAIDSAIWWKVPPHSAKTGRSSKFGGVRLGFGLAGPSFGTGGGRGGGAAAGAGAGSGGSGGGK